MNTGMLIPMWALMAWTCVVCGLAGVERVREIRQRRISLAAIARSHALASTLQRTQAMDNFNNLLQMPVLFYLLCLLAYVAQLSAISLWLMAWMYVLLRFAHSAIQLTRNQVLPRFSVWVLSNVVLLCAWCRCIAQLVRISH